MVANVPDDGGEERARTAPSDDDDEGRDRSAPPREDNDHDDNEGHERGAASNVEDGVKIPRDVLFDGILRQDPREL